MAPRALLQALIGRSVAAGLRTPCRARAPFRISRHREKRRTSPPNTGGPLPGADARGATAIEAGVPSPVSTNTNREKPETKEMWVDSHYCWVVLCKNHWFDLRQNLFFRHRIPLAETDPVASRPFLDGRFRVRCDDCRKEYFYKPSEVLKYEQELPDSFTPHPLCRDF